MDMTGVMCDNAMNNNVMIQELCKLNKFADSPSHTCCFVHIMGLIAKSLICKFNGKNATIKEETKLARLAKELS